jgi:hypothetical protein
MTDPAQFTPEDRVQLKVGGRFTPDTFGPEAYAAINRAVADDPDAHLDAFERLFLSPRPSRRALTELHLPAFLQGLQHLRPQRVQTMARQLSAVMASLARAQAGEAESTRNARPARIDEIARQRRQLARRRAAIAGIVADPAS